MTRYKKYMKERYELQFSEDMEFLPYPVDDKGNVILEDRDVFATRHGLLLVTTYNTLVYRSLFLPNDTQIMVYDDDDSIPELVDRKGDFEIRMYHDMPHYMFMFDNDDNLIAVRYTNKLHLLPIKFE